MDEEAWTRDRTRFLDDVARAAAEGREPTRDHGFRLGPLGQQFATLTYSLLDARTVEEVLDQVVDAAVRLTPDADLVSVTLRAPDGQFSTPVESDPLASTLDKLQYEMREGPCYDAAEPSGPAVSFSANLAVDPHWPRWGPAAADRGVSSVLSTSLVPSPEPPQLSGALNVYSYRANGLDAIDRDILLLLATHASLALAGTTALSRAELRETQLRQAIDSRDVIGQAKGILMARQGVGADEAFDILRRTSQQLNVKLVDLAETLAGKHGEIG